MGGLDANPLAPRKYSQAGARLMASLGRTDVPTLLNVALDAVSTMTELDLELEAYSMDVGSVDSLAHPARGDACFITLARPGGGIGAEIIIEVPCPLALLLIDRALGSARVRIPASRPLREVERGVLAYVASEAVLTVQSPEWRVVSSIGSRSAAATTWGEACELGVIDIGVRVGGVALRASIWLSARTASALWDGRPATSVDAWDSLPIPCGIEVGHSWLTARDVERLTPGWGAPLDLGPSLTTTGSWRGDVFLCAVAKEAVRWRCHWTPDGWMTLHLCPPPCPPTTRLGNLRVSARVGECSPPLAALRCPGRVAPLPFGRELAPEVELYVGDRQLASATLLSLRGRPVFRVETLR